MFGHLLLYLGSQSRLLLPKAVLVKHSKSCPTKMKPVCPGSSGGKGPPGPRLKRELTSGKVRLGFLPDEWFLFFHSKTGVSGPYIFGIVVANYLLSKEIYVLEHEYYSGLSIALMLYLITTKMGPGIGASLDKEVDANIAAWEKGRKEEIDFYKDVIKSCKDAQWRAEGQKVLMDAKKENISMQLEAIYRERLMHVYRMVKGRMDYHVKRYQAEARIHQKWMVGWILENVKKSITAELQQQALKSAIQELSAMASRAK
ncbi:ATP synthase subunit b, mitochondrial-like [Galleria mellonella]|uniref:ATP synthase subunit b n=1 Tax=Galleria mellonella TaxID=7137 RepID=A0A6J1WZJ3_GALME|nr:ATP synthase subunit b, mitochondrial-like [Galleria mellonella]XP_052752535.1 ATP synthase subunit b, mitochondrial-like [Galleria mellonella]